MPLSQASGLQIQESLIYIFLLKLPPQPTHYTLCVSSTFILYCSLCYPPSSGFHCYHIDYCNVLRVRSVTISKLSTLYHGVILIFKPCNNSHITPLLNDLQCNAFKFPNKSTPVLHCGMKVLQKYLICLSVLIFNHFYTNTINIGSLSCKLPSP